jgi:hypothetical protein
LKIKKLVESRRQVKDMLKKEKLTEAQRQQLNIRQLGKEEEEDNFIWGSVTEAAF